MVASWTQVVVVGLASQVVEVENHPLVVPDLVAWAYQVVA